MQAVEIRNDEEGQEEENQQLYKLFNRLNSLVGMKEFKNHISELELMKETLSKWTKNELFPTQSLIFASDYGSGTSEALDILREYIEITEIYPCFDEYGNKISVYFEETEFDIENLVTTDEMRFDELKENLDMNLPSLIGIHIEKWIDKMDSPVFDRLLEFCYKKRNKCVYVFIVPFLEQEHLRRIHKKINNVLSTKLIRFLPYSDEELIEIASREDISYNRKGCE